MPTMLRARADEAGRAASSAALSRNAVVEESDEALMLQVGRGSRDAASMLVGRHLGRIVAFASRTLGDRSEAEDVAQDTFLRLWAHAARWRPGTARLTTWLYRVALNLCLDRLARRRELPLDDAMEPVDPTPSMTATVQQADIGRRVNMELMSLPPQQRIAITLCHHHDLRNIEAADVMGVSIEALESLLARGRRALRGRLRDVV